MLGFLLKLINPLGRILDTIDKRTDAGLERDKAKLAAMTSFASTQAAMMAGPGRWLLALFIVPLGVYFAAIIVYSMLWCRGCAFPQNWSIAALPPPLNEWSGWIVMSMFAYGGAVSAAGIFKR
jgi:hypothetical protein